MADKNNENEEQIFNEDELQDIMNEFESLEREFHEGEETSVAGAEPEQASVVEEEGELNISAEAPAAKTSHSDNVVSMAQVKASKPVYKPASTMSSSGVSMSLELPIGEQVAQIGISPEYGFSFSMDGVELTIDSENGCVMSLPGGMTFTIPVNSEQKAKKSA